MISMHAINYRSKSVLVCGKREGGADVFLRGKREEPTNFRILSELYLSADFVPSISMEFDQ